MDRERRSSVLNQALGQSRRPAPRAAADQDQGLFGLKIRLASPREGCSQEVDDRVDSHGSELSTDLIILPRVKDRGACVGELDAIAVRDIEWPALPVQGGIDAFRHQESWNHREAARGTRRPFRALPSSESVARCSP